MKLTNILKLSIPAAIVGQIVAAGETTAPVMNMDEIVISTQSVIPVDFIIPLFLILILLTALSSSGTAIIPDT